MANYTNSNRESFDDAFERFEFYKSFEDLESETAKGMADIPSYFSSKSRFNPEYLESRSRRKFIFGDYPESSFEDLEKGVESFIDQDKLTGIVTDVKDLFASIDLGGSFKKDRLKATDLPIGVFSFDLASQGLFKPMEYYSKDLDELVDPDKVFKLTKTQFATERVIGPDEKKTYFVDQQQEGTLCMSRKKEYIKSILSDGFTEAEANTKAKSKFAGCRLRFATRTKKVYLTRVGKQQLSADQQGKEKFVDLFIPTGGNASQTPRTLMYATLPALLAAYFLNQAGIKTRILGLNSGMTKYRRPIGIDNYRFMNSYVLKDYNENFDFNLIAARTADSRTFRWLLFKNVAVQLYKLNSSFDAQNMSFGYPVDGEYFDELFERYKRFYIKENSVGSIKNTNPRLMIAAKIVPNPDSTDNRLKTQAVDEFFRIMDAVDLEFNGAKIALPRIRNREERMGNDLNGVRQRLMGVIAKATRTDYTESENSLTDQENKASIELRKRLRKDINTVFTDK